MIAIRSQGQLGNQLFLLAAVLRERRPGEVIIFVGFTELARIIQVRRFGLFLPVPHTFDRKVKRVFRLLAKAQQRICGCGRGGYSHEQTLCRKGRCFWPLIFEFGLCQREELAPLRPVGELVASASSASRQLLATRKQLQSIGVDIGRFASLHIRLGDYERFDVYGTTPVPPVSWYSSAISELRAVEPEIPIVVFSDQLDRARDMLSAHNDIHFFPFDDVASFYAMAGARHGILSASTFSWWAARLAKANHPDGHFLAPKYWMGLNSRRWFPDQNIRSSFLEYRDFA
jgi:hypothetical protein